MTITELVNQSEKAGTPLKMISTPMLLEPVAVGMKKGEPALLAQVNAALYAMDKDGEIDAMWAKWLGPNTQYKMTRDEHVQPITAIKFTPIP
jgi:polar amino acid transport system substrate-binding protein